jgi:hypothetical protein
MDEAILCFEMKIQIYLHVGLHNAEKKLLIAYSCFSLLLLASLRFSLLLLWITTQELLTVALPRTLLILLN